MLPSQYLKTFAAAVSKRSGICIATVEAVLPHVFDEIRYQLTEGTLCVPIESFGTFAVINIPERQRLYSYKRDTPEVRTLPPTVRLKFKPTASFKREIDTQQYDPTRRSFTRHYDDHPIRKRRNMRYNKRRDIYTQQVPGQPVGNAHVIDNYERIERKPTKWQLHRQAKEQEAKGNDIPS